MTNLKNDRYLRALLRKDVDRTPAWMMRQAGRYLPEYKEVRKFAGDFMSLCRNPELACKVTLQPLERYPLDAAILFSDILTIPDAMGLGLYFTPGEGPKFKNPIQNIADVEKIPFLNVNKDLQYVMDAVKVIRTQLNGSVPLIGFSGSPWTLATYMVEGQSTKVFTIIKKMMYQEPQTLHLLLDKLSLAVADYLNAQILAGAQSVMIFDTWGGVLGHREYKEFSLNYMQRIIKKLIRHHDGMVVPVTVFTKGGGLWLSDIANIGADAVGVDWTVNLQYARELIGNKVAIQGNMDPSVLYSNEEFIDSYVKQILNDYGVYNGHVFNLGHGIHQDVNPMAPSIMLSALHKYSSLIHAKN